MVARYLASDQPGHLRLSVAEPWRAGPPQAHVLAALPPGPLALNPLWVALAGAGPDHREVRLFDRARMRQRAHLRLDGASEVAVRICGTRLAVGDDRGRVLVLDLEEGALLRDLRV